MGWPFSVDKSVDIRAGAGRVFAGDPLDLWERDTAMRERARESGFISDEAKARQFLAAKSLTLDKPSETMFLDYIVRDFYAAVEVLTPASPWRLCAGRVGEAVPALSGLGRPEPDRMGAIRAVDN